MTERKNKGSALHPDTPNFHRSDILFPFARFWARRHPRLAHHRRRGEQAYGVPSAPYSLSTENGGSAYPRGLPCVSLGAVLASFGGEPLETLVELQSCPEEAIVLPGESSEGWAAVLNHVYNRLLDWTPAEAAVALPVIDKYNFEQLVPGVGDALSKPENVADRSFAVYELMTRLSPETVRRWFRTGFKRSAPPEAFDAALRIAEESLSSQADATNRQLAGFALDGLGMFLRSMQRNEAPAQGQPQGESTDPSPSDSRLAAIWDSLVQAYEADAKAESSESNQDVRCRLVEMLGNQLFRSCRSAEVADLLARNGNANILSRTRNFDRGLLVLFATVVALGVCVEYWFMDLDWYTEEIHSAYMNDLTEVEALRAAGRKAVDIKRKRDVTIQC